MSDLNSQIMQLIKRTEIYSNESEQLYEKNASSIDKIRQLLDEKANKQSTLHALHRKANRSDME